MEIDDRFFDRCKCNRCGEWGYPSTRFFTCKTKNCPVILFDLVFIGMGNVGEVRIILEVERNQQPMDRY